MSEVSLQTQIALLQKSVADMEMHIKTTDAAVVALRDERDRAMKWGVITLGATVMSMGVWIFNFVTGGVSK